MEKNRHLLSYTVMLAFKILLTHCLLSSYTFYAEGAYSARNVGEVMNQALVFYS